jgi:hypothetical protein
MAACASLSVACCGSVAAFSDEEEDAVGLTSVVPFALETRLRELGARYERGRRPG